MRHAFLGRHARMEPCKRRSSEILRRMGHDDPGAAHPAAIEPERRTRGAARLQCGCGAEHFMRRARRPDNGLQRRPTQEASTGRACTNSGAREKRSLNERSTRCTGA
eukprot:CAMPEP_0176277394 /NCGR_PEP_ID=MMETSP0121_2-20121125/48254_1 /TAXON_ID=160619 /ORGANISM="Kryptoperidinium foliaceum, Strain CCMP 1326" /LENGTH=106 /DNA_ID=CAMNT_0017617691 /DNA_START=297 /DNA_END=613 /DNA_ORIENTATION=-